LYYCYFCLKNAYLILDFDIKLFCDVYKISFVNFIQEKNSRQKRKTVTNYLRIFHIYYTLKFFLSISILVFIKYHAISLTKLPDMEICIYQICLIYGVKIVEHFCFFWNAVFPAQKILFFLFLQKNKNRLGRIFQNMKICFICILHFPFKKVMHKLKLSFAK
jgi:hypothetical protein